MDTLLTSGCVSSTSKTLNEGNFFIMSLHKEDALEDRFLRTFSVLSFMLSISVKRIFNCHLRYLRQVFFRCSDIKTESLWDLNLMIVIL